ncbi:hypothetical protein F5Y10DRAFT_268902 [Nemania abortiva]|nr:hypothetical protein F5Y10DRAFT_268902 [Nemania abortiva]
MNSEETHEETASDIAREIEYALAQIPYSEHKLVGSLKAIMLDIRKNTRITPDPDLERKLRSIRQLVGSWDYERKSNRGKSVVRRFLDWVFGNPDLEETLRELGKAWKELSIVGYSHPSHRIRTQTYTTLNTQRMDIQCMYHLNGIPNAHRELHAGKDLLQRLDDDIDGWYVKSATRTTKGATSRLVTVHIGMGQKIRTDILVSDSFDGACDGLAGQLSKYEHSGWIEDLFHTQANVLESELTLISKADRPIMTILWVYHNVCIHMQLFLPIDILELDHDRAVQLFYAHAASYARGYDLIEVGKPSMLKGILH